MVFQFTARAKGCYENIQPAGYLATDQTGTLYFADLGVSPYAGDLCRIRGCVGIIALVALKYPRNPMGKKGKA